MLNHIRGTITEKKTGQAVIEAGGLGLSVRLSLPSFFALPEPPAEATVLTRFIIREENWEIFGFLSPAEREAFDILTSVSRVGPRLALTVLSSLDPHNLAQILINQDLASLAAIKGIGAKTAERLLVELKEKAVKLAGMTGTSTAGGGQKTVVIEEAVQALLTLGYSRAEAEKAVRTVAPGPDTDLSEVIKEALKTLSR
ncbi:MAG: Holliday junction branch migration protein RuvA [Deltaproteobacteria bacterium]|jgi:Holliday junction DNA helicase RuvA|nr:Holliday junction branch migration protein RuvA [Deltaproteobacteria bacterium]